MTNHRSAPRRHERPAAGGGPDNVIAVMIAALLGWTVVEGLQLRVVSKFAAV